MITDDMLYCVGLAAHSWWLKQQHWWLVGGARLPITKATVGKAADKGGNFDKSHMLYVVHW